MNKQKTKNSTVSMSKKKAYIVRIYMETLGPGIGSISTMCLVQVVQ